VFAEQVGAAAVQWASEFRDLRHSAKALFVVRALIRPVLII
jgi:hypothetical protein